MLNDPVFVWLRGTIQPDDAFNGDLTFCTVKIDMTMFACSISLDSRRHVGSVQRYINVLLRKQLKCE